MPPEKLTPAPPASTKAPRSLKLPAETNSVTGPLSEASTSAEVLSSRSVLALSTPLLTVPAALTSTPAARSPATPPSSVAALASMRTPETVKSACETNTMMRPPTSSAAPSPGRITLTVLGLNPAAVGAVSP